MFAIQSVIEPKQEQCLRDNHPFNSDHPLWHNPRCAWCLSEQNIPAGEGSHGICRRHANQLLLQQRKLRSRHVATSGPVVKLSPVISFMTSREG
jgi:hypothetical protein